MGILRVLLSLILQENTQAVIVKKLSSHTRYIRLRAALWEYNKIFKSTHVLNLINDMSLRQAIRKARNRTEAYHQLQSAIRKIYKGVFSGQRTSDNLVRAESCRLISNIIIAYNAILLNNLYKKVLAKHGKAFAINTIQHISPVAWAHISFTGKYSFKNRRQELRVDEMIEILQRKLEVMT